MQCNQRLEASLKKILVTDHMKGSSKQNKSQHLIKRRGQMTLLDVIHGLSVCVDVSALLQP